MNTTVLGDNGKTSHPWMGCYGIGVTHVVAAAIEQNHDDSGIIWPNAIAPFQVALVPMNAHKITTCARRVRASLSSANSGWLETCCLMTATRVPASSLLTWSLWRLPHRLVIGDRGLDNGETGIQRPPRQTKTTMVPADAIVDFLRKKARLIERITVYNGHVSHAALEPRRGR